MIQVVQDWRPLWPWVEQGLREVLAKTGSRWLPADVYMELKSGASVLVTIEDDAGFMVCKRLQDYDGQVLFVWVLWGPGELAPHEDTLNRELDDMARTAGCVRVQMRSPRNGWGQRPGWTKLETIYEREV